MIVMPTEEKVGAEIGTRCLLWLAMSDGNVTRNRHNSFRSCQGLMSSAATPNSYQGM
jgi:hypothetical protein